MVRVSNWLIVGLNVLTLAVALTAVGFSLWFHVRDGSRCQRVLKAPLMAVGVALLVVAAVGLAGALSGASVMMWLYLSMLLALIVGLVVFTIFTVMVTNKGLGQAISAAGQGVGDHRLGNYSKWLQKYVVGAKNWEKIKSCMQAAEFCKLVVDLKNDDVYKQINPIMSGCCKPPVYCGFERKNGSYWAPPKKGPAASDPDCKAWSNRPEKMCFDCDSCKKAVLGNIRREWKVLALINICIVIVVVAVYSVGCCALRNNRFYRHTNNYDKPNP